MWSTLTRCWEIAPSSTRIVEDILGQELVLRNIVAAKGCVVADCNLRNGRRYVSADGRKVLNSKPKKRQRKATLQEAEAECHPDALHAKLLLCNASVALI